MESWGTPVLKEGLALTPPQPPGFGYLTDVQHTACLTKEALSATVGSIPKAITTLRMLTAQKSLVPLPLPDYFHVLNPELPNRLLLAEGKWNTSILAKATEVFSSPKLNEVNS